MTDVFGIARYVGWYENGRQVYGIRGQGEDYKKFYAWLSTVKPIWELTDWPWHYVTLNDLTELTMYNVFEKHIEDYIDTIYPEYYDENGMRK